MARWPSRVKVKKITKILRKMQNCGDGELDAENEWHSGWVMEIFTTVSRHRSRFAQQCFAVENCEKQ